MPKLSVQLMIDLPSTGDPSVNLSHPANLPTVVTATVEEVSEGELDSSQPGQGPFDVENPATLDHGMDTMEVLYSVTFDKHNLVFYIDHETLEFHHSFESHRGEPARRIPIPLASVCPRWQSGWKVFEGPTDARKTPELYTQWALRPAAPQGDGECPDRLRYEIMRYERLAAQEVYDHRCRNVCQYYGCVVKDGFVVAIKLEKMGSTLQDLVDTGWNKGLSDSEVNQVISDVRSALEYFESMGLVYIDLNPSCIRHSLDLLAEGDHRWCLVDLEHVAILGKHRAFFSPAPRWTPKPEVYDSHTKERQLANLRKYLETGKKPTRAYGWDRGSGSHKTESYSTESGDTDRYETESYCAESDEIETDETRGNETDTEESESDETESDPRYYYYDDSEWEDSDCSSESGSEGYSDYTKDEWHEAVNRFVTAISEGEGDSEDSEEGDSDECGSGCECDSGYGCGCEEDESYEYDTEEDEGDYDDNEEDEGEYDENEEDEGEHDENEGDDYQSDESEGDKSEGGEREGDESEGDESEGGESEGDESEGDESEGDQSQGGYSEGGESQDGETHNVSDKSVYHDHNDSNNGSHNASGSDEHNQADISALTLHSETESTLSTTSSPDSDIDVTRITEWLRGTRNSDVASKL